MTRARIIHVTTHFFVHKDCGIMHYSPTPPAESGTKKSAVKRGKVRIYTLSMDTKDARKLRLVLCNKPRFRIWIWNFSGQALLVFTGKNNIPDSLLRKVR